MCTDGSHEFMVIVSPRPHFTPKEEPSAPIGQEAGWGSVLVWTQRLEEISFVSAGDRTPVVQSVVKTL
jgi:hypothetical protein